MKSRHEHTPDAIRDRLARGHVPSYLRDWIYGGIDGAVTTFAVVSGVVGADLSSRVILILGIANLLADGFSMAAGNYSGTRAERDEEAFLKGIELDHIARHPDGEREELRQIYARKGFAGGDLERAVEVLSADRERWVEAMLRDEYGLPGGRRSPWTAGLTTFSAFVLCGAGPLLPYVAGWPQPFAVAIALTAAIFLTIGCVRARWSPYAWWKTGLGTLGVGGAAAAVAFLVGRLLSGLA